MTRAALFLFSASLCLFGNLHAADEAPAPAASAADAIFDQKKIWEIHLSFSPGEWEAMEPKQGPRPERREGQSFLLGPEGGRNGIAAAFGIEFNMVRGKLQFGEKSFDNVGVRYKGNGTFLGSRDSLKRSIKLDMNHFVKGQKLDGLTQINLHNSIRDRSNMNEAIAYQLFRDAGVPAPKTAFAKVYITVPDQFDRQYFGLYNLVEDVGNSFAEQNFKSSEGLLLKPVTSQLFADLGDDWKSYNQIYDPKGKISEEQKRRVIETCQFISRTEGADFAGRIGNFIDLENFARYLALTVWLSDLDGILGPGQNFYLYLDPATQKFSFVPWDQDQTFGQFLLSGNQSQRENLNIHKPWVGQNRFLEKIFAVEAFKSQYLARMKEFNETLLLTDRLSGQVDEFASLLREPVKQESEQRLADLNKLAAGESIEVPRSPGFNGGTIKPIKAFIPVRGESVT